MKRTMIPFIFQAFNFFGFCLLGLLFPLSVFALKINEVMADLPGTDTDREWIEIYNDGSEALDLSSIKFSEGGTNHTIKSFEGNPIIESEGYGIIASNPDIFQSDNPNFNGNLFDSTFSLSNEGELLEIKSLSNESLDSWSYVLDGGSKGKGASINRNGLQSKDGDPTPGEENSLVFSSLIVEEEQTNSGEIKAIKKTANSSLSTSASYSGSTIKLKLMVDIGVDRIIPVNTEISLKVRSQSDGLKGKIRCRWTFGDGEQEEGCDVNHYYMHAGEYIVVANIKQGDEEVVSRILVKAFEPEISLNYDLNKGLELVNLSVHELNLSGWYIKDDKGKFVFPIDTIVLPKKEITLPEYTYSINSKSGVTLYSPNKKFFRKISFLETVNNTNDNLTSVAHLGVSQVILDNNLSLLDFGSSSSRIFQIEDPIRVEELVGKIKSRGFWENLKNLPMRIISWAKIRN